jgi:hypothetical protein
VLTGDETSCTGCNGDDDSRGDCRARPSPRCGHIYEAKNDDTRRSAGNRLRRGGVDGVDGGELR